MSPLHAIGDALRWWLGQVPMLAVRAVFVAIPLLLMLWVLRLPAPAALPAGRTARWSDDLRLWAWLALSLQVIVYVVL